MIISLWGAFCPGGLLSRGLLSCSRLIYITVCSIANSEKDQRMTYVLFFRESPVWHVLKVVLGVAVVIKVSKDVSDILLKVIE
jgi:hypothetical protein